MDFIGNAPVVLHGEKVSVDVPGMDDIYIADTFLIFTSIDPESHLKIFSINNLEKLAAICPSGRAKNEFVSTPINHSKQLFEQDGELYIPLVDYGRLKMINVNTSVKQQKTVVESSENCLPITEGNFVLLDISMNKRFESHNGVMDEITKEAYPSKYYIIQNMEQKEIPVFSRIMNGKGNDRYKSMFCHGVLTKHPDKDIVIQTLDYMDYILVFDLNNKKYYAIHQIGSLSFEDDVPAEITFAFTDCICTEKGFITLHCDEKLNRHIILFDWDCNIIKTFASDVAINRIAYDKKNNNLYGIDRVKENVYKFNLNYNSIY